MKTIFLNMLFLAVAVCAAERVETDDQSGSLVLKINPDWATVTVDGSNYGESRQYDGTAAVLTVNPGTHIVKISAQGYLDYEKRIYINDSREVIEVQLRSTDPNVNAVLPTPQKKVFGSLYALASAVNPEEVFAAGMGGSVQFALNSQTVLHACGEVFLPIQSADISAAYTSLKFGTAITPFNGDIKPQFGFLMGGISTPLDPQFLVGGFLRGLYSFSPKTNLFMGVAPEITFGNSSAFYLNFSAGFSVLLGK